MRKPVIPALVLLATAGLAALTGCSAGSEPAANEQETTTSQSPTTEASPSEKSDAAPAGEQTVAESCAVAQDVMVSVQSEMSGALQGLSSGDVTSVISALQTFEVTLGDAVEEVTNPEVDAALTDFQSKFGSFNEILAGAQDGGMESLDQTALQNASTELQTSAQGVQEICA